MSEVLTTPAETGQLSQIRTILGVYFPKVNFNCSTDYKDDYCCILIGYTDGISLTRVKNAVKGFNLPPDPQIQKRGVKVIVERKMSQRIKNLIQGEIKTVFAMDHLPKEDDWFEPIKGPVRVYMNKIFNMRDFE
ncbi:hypothetical protein [Dysgonomonas termitidis]|uniref:Uncharacterized protein n=1 Tax=Dysgonomonas termitidis TaxID=1516126 RepID=A0ABV9KTN3_9BACT